jgi:omega-amidase
MNDPKNTLSITTVQSFLHWEDKEANLQMFSEKIDSIKEPMEIVVLPEMFSTAFSMNPERFAETMDGPTVEWMRTTAMEKRIVLTGSIIIRDDEKFYNRLIWMLPSGQFGVYDKRHLFGFAEEDKHYDAGNKRLIASVNGWKINCIVCYDLRFPVWVRQSMHHMGADPGPEFDVIICVANWPERRNHAWKTLLQARAIENQSYVVGVNRVGNDGNNIYHSGDTMVVDPMGEILHSAAHNEEVNTIVLDKNKLQETRDRLPFLRDADNFLIAL